MQLLGLTLAGFKSFARPTRLRFEQGLTAIIGPNGSGKSNLAEAVRWVLGEQSTKQLRAHSSQEVIFAGNTSYKRSHKAHVELILSNESNRFPIDAPEITIGRSLTTQGESEYTLNGDPVRLIDLQHMIAQTGIGAKSYTVISQGMVDRYVNATPQARRELFDEATGIKALQIKVSQAVRTLTTSQQQAHEIETVISELFPRLQVLARQVRKEEQRERLREEFMNIQAIWLEQEWHRVSEHLQQEQQSVKNLQAHFQEASRYRQEQEKALMQSVKDTTLNTAKIEEDLHRATREYEYSYNLFEQATKTKERLLEELKIIRADLKQAQSELGYAQQEAVTFDWLAKTRQLLRKCVTYLKEIQTTGSVNQQETEKLSKEVSTGLALLHDNYPIESARSLLEQVGKPLQQVARLTAIEEERKQQLQHITIPKAPTREIIEQLKEKLRQINALKISPSHIPQQALEEARTKEFTAQKALNEAQISLQHLQETFERHEQTILREKGTQFLHSVQETTNIPKGTANVSEKHVEQAKNHLLKLGEPDPIAIREHAEVAHRYEHLQQQLTDIQQTIRNIEIVKNDLEEHMRGMFSTQFAIINNSFSHYLASFFTGSHGSLELHEQGIEIRVVLPGKRVSSLQALSGGEKTLVALALLLAVVDAQHPPFLVLDEVDAALDEANARRFALALKEKSEHIQCIMITHNRETMSQADILYGVTMDGNNSSQIYSVRLQDIPS